LKDIVLVALVVLAFAMLVTVHVTIAVGLARRMPRWRSVVALLVVVLAPYWAWREGMRRRAVLWIASAILYVAARAGASF
jgi:hypothetical protein